LLQRLFGLDLPDWAHDAASTLPVIEYVTGFVAVVALLVIAPKERWLLPVAGWTLVLSLVAFTAHWRAKYFREVRLDKNRSTNWVIVAVCSCLLLSAPILSLVRDQFEAPTGVLSLECSPDLRTGEHSSMDGELPKEALFLEPDGRSVQIAIANEPSRDANGYLYEIRQFFIRCDLRNAVTSADAAKATVTFQGWFIIKPNAVAPGEILFALDPGLMARQKAPDISAVIEAPALGHTPFEFAIVNRAPRPVYLSKSSDCAYRTARPFFV
jgi:hypothetical protein